MVILSNKYAHIFWNNFIYGYHRTAITLRRDYFGRITLAICYHYGEFVIKVGSV